MNNDEIKEEIAANQRQMREIDQRITAYVLELRNELGIANPINYAVALEKKNEDEINALSELEFERYTLGQALWTNLHQKERLLKENKRLESNITSTDKSHSRGGPSGFKTTKKRAGRRKTRRKSKKRKRKTKRRRKKRKTRKRRRSGKNRKL